LPASALIELSSRHVTSNYMLLATMAHEMVHLYLETHRMHGDDHHGEAFQRLADQICEIHDFNRRDF
jgi:predicted SprT family Zn-dependent metalloprotease